MPTSSPSDNTDQYGNRVDTRGMLSLLGSGDSGTSAIDSLLGHLTDPGPQLTPQGPPQLPPPQAAPLPQMNAATAQGLLGNAPGTQGPSVLSRVVHGLLSLPGQVGGAIADNLGNPKTPPGYDQFLTPDQMASMHPNRLASILDALGGVNPQHVYEQRLNNVVALNQAATQRAETQRQLAARHAMAQLFPQPTPTGDPIRDRENTQQWLAAQFGYATSHNLPDIAKDMESALRGVMSAPPPAPKGVTLNPLQRLVDPTTGKVIAEGNSDTALKPSDYTQYIDPKTKAIHILPKNVEPQPGWETIPQQTASIRIDAANANVDKRLGVTLQNQYRTSITPMTKQALALDKAINSLDTAQNSTNPNERKILFGSAMSQFVQSADQPTNLRYQLLKYYEDNLDPSIKGRYDFFWNKMVNGELPPEKMAAMADHLRQLRTMTFNQIESRRGEFLRNNPMLDDTQLPSTQSYFPFGGSPTAAPMSSATPTSAGGRTVKLKNGKTFNIDKP